MWLFSLINFNKTNNFSEYKRKNWPISYRETANLRNKVTFPKITPP
jgi:hypothetical protein